MIKHCNPIHVCHTCILSKKVLIIDATLRKPGALFLAFYITPEVMPSQLIIASC